VGNKTIMMEKKHILIVEDNKTSLQIMTLMLSRLGHTCDCVINGLEAVKILTKKKFDIVLMDCQMPVMDGYEATQRIRGENSEVINPSVPIIAVTANVCECDRERCFDVGMNEFIGKPVRIASLKTVLERFMIE
jgi:CheY-like chemotaxis protein